MSNDFPEISALKAGDSYAWDEAFSHLWPIALNAARHPAACLVPWEAEDVASEALIELIGKIETVTSTGHAKALTATIAYRRAIELARRKSAIKRSLPENFVTPTQISWPTELTDLELSDMIVLLRQALDILDTDTRSIVEDRFVLGLSYEEIRQQRCIPMGTVCTRLSRGLRAVRGYLEKSPLLMKELKEYLR